MLDLKLTSQLVTASLTSGKALSVFESRLPGKVVFFVHGQASPGVGIHLTESQVRELRNALGQWLDRNAVEPAHFRAARVA